MKVVRLSLASAATLLNKVTDLRVIYLVRDPRATLHSRREMEWCIDQPSCIRPESLCTQLVGDYHLADQLQNQFKDRFTILRLVLKKKRHNFLYLIHFLTSYNAQVRGFGGKSSQHFPQTV